MKAIIIAGALFVLASCLHGRYEIQLRIDREVAPADSVVAAARVIEPRLGEIKITSDTKIVRGFMTDSLADTLALVPLDSVPGVDVIWKSDSLGL